MKMLFVMAILSAFASMTRADVWTSVYRCDEKTPLGAIDPNHPSVYRDVMVGTHLVLIVSSDTPSRWVGNLYIPTEYTSYGTLNGRGYIPKPMNYAESCLEAAGLLAFARPLNYLPGIEGEGFDMKTTASLGTPEYFTAAGDWFIFDYYADQVGFCDILLLSAQGDDFSRVLVGTVSLVHVPSRDFDGDGIVNFMDFARLSSRWQPVPVIDSNAPDTQLDLNVDQRIDLRDLALFSEYWLERTECTESAVDPNA